VVEPHCVLFITSECRSTRLRSPHPAGRRPPGRVRGGGLGWRPKSTGPGSSHVLLRHAHLRTATGGAQRAFPAAGAGCGPRGTAEGCCQVFICATRRLFF
jgi:hypothetical protein